MNKTESALGNTKLQEFAKTVEKLKKSILDKT